VNSISSGVTGARSRSRAGRRASECTRVGGGPPVRLTLVVAALLAATSFLAGCQRHPPPREASMPQRPIADVLATHTPALMRVAGVVGTYEGRGRDGAPCIVVMVLKSTPELRRAIPDSLEEWPVRIEETGEIHAMPDSGR
jgi:hypothetical protein